MKHYKLQKMNFMPLYLDEGKNFTIEPSTLRECIEKGTTEERLTIIWAYLNSKDYKRKLPLSKKGYNNIYYALMGSVDAQEKELLSKWGMAFNAVADYCRGVRGTLYSHLAHLYSLKAKTEIYYSLLKIEEALNMYLKERGEADAEAAIIDFLRDTPYTIVEGKGKGSLRLKKDGQTKQELRREIAKEIESLNSTTATFKAVVEAFMQLFTEMGMEEYIPVRLNSSLLKMREGFLQEVAFSPSYDFAEEFGIELVPYESAEIDAAMKEGTYKELKSLIELVWQRENK